MALECLGVEWACHSFGGVQVSDIPHTRTLARATAGHVPHITERGVCVILRRNERVQLELNTGGVHSPNGVKVKKE